MGGTVNGVFNGKKLTTTLRLPPPRSDVTIYYDRGLLPGFASVLDQASGKLVAMVPLINGSGTVAVPYGKYTADCGDKRKKFTVRLPKTEVEV